MSREVFLGLPEWIEKRELKVQLSGTLPIFAYVENRKEEDDEVEDGEREELNTLLSRT